MDEKSLSPLFPVGWVGGGGGGVFGAVVTTVVTNDWCITTLHTIFLLKIIRPPLWLRRNMFHVYIKYDLHAFSV